MSAYENAARDGRRFLSEACGLPEEELQGLDVVKFIGDYQLRTRSYTPEALRKILADERELYAIREETPLFYLFSAEGRALTKDDREIERIGFYLNSGTFVQRTVYDLVHGLLYVDDAQPHGLSEGQVARLKRMPELYKIAEWERHTEGRESPNTGNYSWKLVLQLPGDAYAVYDGFTGDMTHLPPRFSDVLNTLMSVARHPGRG